MLLDLILTAGIPVWVGRPERTQKRLLWAGRLKERFPTVADLRSYLGMPVGPGDRSATWTKLFVYRTDGGVPVGVTEYALTPLGHIKGGGE